MKTISEAHGLSVTAAAGILRVAPPTLSTLLNAKADLSGDMALWFERAFGVDMETLMRMQNSFDIAPTRSRAKQSAWIVTVRTLRLEEELKDTRLPPAGAI